MLKPHISVSQVRFTGSPIFDPETGEESVTEESVRYVGQPSPEVDAAWNKLTTGELDISGQVVYIGC